MSNKNEIKNKKDIDLAFEHNAETIRETICLSCEEIYDETTNKYQVIIYKPFYNKSSWRKTEHATEEKLTKQALVDITSALKKKYNSKRDDSFVSFMRTVGYNLSLYTKNIDSKLYEELQKRIVEHDKAIRCREIKKYACEYYQYLDDDSNPESNKKLKEFYDASKDEYDECKIAYQKRYEYNFSFTAFVKLLIKSSCSYCGISLEQLKSLRKKWKIHSKSGRGFSLEIDRKSPNLEYTEKNCCMSCYWCNNAKTDEFNVTEFEEIAKGINAAWNKRGEKIEGWKDIKFPENFYAALKK